MRFPRWGRVAFALTLFSFISLGASPAEAGGTKLPSAWTANCHSVTLVDETVGSNGIVTSALDSKVEYSADGIRCKDLSHWIVELDPASLDLAATQALNPNLALEKTRTGLKIDTEQSAGSLKTVFVVSSEIIAEGAMYFSKAGPFATAGHLSLGEFGSDVTVDLKVVPNEPKVGELTSFELSLSNLGPEATVDTKVQLSLPDHFVLLNVVLPSSGVTATTIDQGIEFKYGSVEAAAVITVKVEGYLSSTGGNDVVAATAIELSDRHVVNNEAELTFVTQVAQAANVDLSQQPQEVYVADKVKATYTVSNESYVAVTNVQMEFKLSSSDGGAAQYTAVTVSKGTYEIRDNTVYVAVTELKAGETMTVETETEYTAAGTIQTTATVRSDNTVEAVSTVHTTATVRPEAPKVTATYSSAEFPAATVQTVYYTVDTIQSATATVQTKVYATVGPNTVEVEAGTVKQDDRDITRDCIVTKRADGGFDLKCDKIVFQAGTNQVSIELTPQLKGDRLREDLQIDSDFIVDTGTVSVKSTIGVIAKLVPGGFELVPFEGNPTQVAQAEPAEAEFEGNNYTAGNQSATTTVYVPKQEVEVSLVQVAYGETVVRCGNPPCDRLVIPDVEYTAAVATPVKVIFEAGHQSATAEAAAIEVEAVDSSGRVVGSSVYTFEVLPKLAEQCPEKEPGVPICEADPGLCCQLRECIDSPACR
ncbi:MAG TPA: hypothetical protein VJR29_09255 [bacterium]|nr:hypothetical protein [bacterium]